jgi:hypothetical protein
MASSFGVFQIVADDGRRDHMIMATELLNQRIRRIREVRRASGFAEEDTYPSLLDIERTHIIFPNAHFKPFAAIAMEYHRVECETGGQKLGSDMRFNLPIYGDFIADMAFYVLFNELVYLPNAGTPKNRGSFRYCDFPGERLPTLTRFAVNGNPLDKYTNDAYVFHRQYRVPPNKYTGWCRLVGQEVPHTAHLAQQTEAQPLTRVKMEVCDGFQTARRSHPPLEILTPVLLWFCDDFRLSIPSVSIPHGQRWLTISTAPSTDLVEIVNSAGVTDLTDDDATLSGLEINDVALYVNNLFVNSEVHDIFIRRIGFTLIRVHLWHETQLTATTGKIKLDSLMWPIETMFFGFRPVQNYDLSQATTIYADHPMYSRCGGYGTLQNWHRFGRQTLTTESVYGVATTQTDTQAEADFAAMTVVSSAAPVANVAALATALANAFFADHGTNPCPDGVPLPWELLRPR